MCDVIKHCYTDKDKKYDERANTYYLKLIPYVFYFMTKNLIIPIEF